MYVVGGNQATGTRFILNNESAKIIMRRTMQSSVRLSREMCAASKFYAYFLSIALYCVDNNEIKLMKKKNKRKEKRNKNLILYANGLHNVPFSSCSRRQTINTQTIITILFVFSRFFKQLKRRQGQ